jgi:rhodanese-related sulfurtransferase
MQDLTVFIANHMALSYSFAGLLILLLFIEFFRAKRNKVRINTAYAVQLINRQHANVVDIRPEDSYRGGHIIDATCISANELSQNQKKIERFKNKPLILVCGTGTDSQKIAASLAKQGYNIYAIAGGMRAWSDAGLPLVKN